MGTKRPYAEWPSVDQVAKRMSGFISFTGKDAASPTRVGEPLQT